MSDKYLIINADDFGMCKSANDAIIELFECGAIKSSTIMMPCKYAEEAVKFSIDNPQYAVGIHLTMTSEWRQYNWSPLTDGKSLRNEKGFMWPESDDFAKHADLEETRLEIIAQIQKAHDLGMKPSHVDNHMGSLYGLEGNLRLLPTTLKVCRDFGYAFRMCTKPLKDQCPEGIGFMPRRAESAVFSANTIKFPCRIISYSPSGTTICVKAMRLTVICSLKI